MSDIAAEYNSITADIVALKQKLRDLLKVDDEAYRRKLDSFGEARARARREGRQVAAAGFTETIDKLSTERQQIQDSIAQTRAMLAETERQLEAWIGAHVRPSVLHSPLLPDPPRPPRMSHPADMGD